MEKVGLYQKGDIYAKTKHGELIIPQGGSLYFIGGTYMHPYVNRNVDIFVKEAREVESTRHDAIGDVIQSYEEGKFIIPFMQGRPFEDVCRLIGKHASGYYNTGVGIRVYDDENRRRFSKLRPAASNRQGTEAGRALGESIRRGIEREGISRGVGESEGGVSLYSAGYNPTSYIEEKTLDRWLQHYAIDGSPNGSQAWIAWIRPSE